MAMSGIKDKVLNYQKNDKMNNMDVIERGILLNSCLKAYLKTLFLIAEGKLRHDC